jgi:hypothetical protein
MGRRQQGGTFPEWIALSDEERDGHNLERLRNRVIKQGRRDSRYESDEHFSLWVDLLREDDLVVALLQVLSDFGEASRYFYLDRLRDRPRMAIDPTESWRRFVDFVAEETDSTPSLLAAIINGASEKTIYQEIELTIRHRLQSFIISLCELHRAYSPKGSHGSLNVFLGLKQPCSLPARSKEPTRRRPSRRSTGRTTTRAEESTELEARTP